MVRESGARSALTPTVAIYGLVLVVTFVGISTTYYRHPLFPIQYNSIEYNAAWLAASVLDYYGACVCFGGVVLSSEPSWARGIAWNLGFMLLGSPVCCLWIILRLYRGGSLQLVDTAPRNRGMMLR